MDEVVKHLLVLELIIILLMKIFYKKILGFFGEHWVKEEVLKLDKQNYKIINDVMIESNESTHQIDHLIISKYGIFVIETKQFNGFIKGNEYDKKWIQYSGKKKFYINNPMHQNYGHIMALKELLEIDVSNFIPIVCIPSRAKVNVESRIPVARINTLLDIIYSYKEEKNIDIDQIVKKINILNIPDKKKRKEHVFNVKKLAKKNK